MRGKMTKIAKLRHSETNHNRSKIGCAMKLSTLSSEPPDTSLLQAPMHFRIDYPCALLRGLFSPANSPSFKFEFFVTSKLVHFTGAEEVKGKCERTKETEGAQERSNKSYKEQRERQLVKEINRKRETARKRKRK